MNVIVLHLPVLWELVPNNLSSILMPTANGVVMHLIGVHSCLIPCVYKWLLS